VSVAKLALILGRLIEARELSIAFDGDTALYFIPLTASEGLALRLSQSKNARK
jgi:hypothetical protein